MDVELRTIAAQNLTLVYEGLDAAKIDTRPLKALRGEGHPPAPLMDTPAMIVAIFPPEPVIVQIGDRRIRLTRQDRCNDIETVPLWDYAAVCHTLATEAGSKLIAYGINFDLQYTLQADDVGTELVRGLLRQPDRIATALGGELSGTVPRFRYRRGEAAYDLVLEPDNNAGLLNVHINIHYQPDDVSLPAADELHGLFRDEYDYLLTMIPALVQEIS